LSAAADMFVFQKTTALCYVDTEQILDGALLFLGTKSKQSFFLLLSFVFRTSLTLSFVMTGEGIEEQKRIFLR
jgi:hypothetical protein